MKAAKPGASAKPRYVKSINVASPLLKRMFELIDAGRFGYVNVAKAAGVGRTTLVNARRGRHSPQFVTVESVIAAIGYRLVMRKTADAP